MLGRLSHASAKAQQRLVTSSNKPNNNTRAVVAARAQQSGPESDTDAPTGSATVSTGSSSSKASSGSVSYSDFVERVASKNPELSKKQVKKIVDSTVDVVRDAVCAHTSLCFFSRV